MAFWRDWFRTGEADVYADAAFIDGSGKLAVPVGSAMRACVNRITSRAAAVEFIVDNDDVPNRPTGDDGGGREFYAALLEDLLIQGACIAYPNPDRAGYFCPGIIGGSVYHSQTRKWHIQRSVVQDGSYAGQVFDADEVFFATLRPLAGKDIYLPVTPQREIIDALLLYERGRKHQLDYSTHGNKIGLVLQAKAEVINPKTGKNLLNDVAKRLKNRNHNYGAIRMPMEAELKEGPKAQPPEGRAVELAIQEVARFYGVPLQLLQTEVSSVADDELIESRLLQNAVFPVLERLTAAWSRRLMRKVDFNPMDLARPTLGARTAAVKNLAQAGVFARNEIRAKLGYGPLLDAEGKEDPRGYDLASPAGAPDQDKDTGNSQNADVK